MIGCTSEQYARTRKRILFRFERIFLRNGINIYLSYLMRANRKFDLKTEKFARCLRMWKKSSTFADESCEISFIRTAGERTPIKQSSAGGLFLDSGSRFSTIVFGGKIARLLFFSN